MRIAAPWLAPAVRVERFERLLQELIAWVAAEPNDAIWSEVAISVALEKLGAHVPDELVELALGVVVAVAHS